MARLRPSGCALLESALPMAGQAAWSFIAGPALAALYTDQTGTRLERDGRVKRRWDDPFSALADMTARVPVRIDSAGTDVPEGLDFVGGWVGVLGYDAARFLHRLPKRAQHDPVLPAMHWRAVDQVLAFHHASARWWQCTASGPVDAWPWSCEARASVWAHTVRRARAPRASLSRWACGAALQRMDRPDFEAGVEAIRARIAAGDMLQVNLTRREDRAFEGDPWALYEDLAAAHPAPFCAYLEAPSFVVASCSPERFLRLRGCDVQARPIKGTIARGQGAEADAAQRVWLAASAKDRAENLMIVDLMRNDLGRVAETGSVRVPSLFALEAHASVWQMVSTVTATLRPECGPADLLRACWPPGSMTGAPKLAAMQAIEALEPVTRGFYAGSIGYLDCRGNLDLSVVIRSIVVADGLAMLQLGGGIVSDSDPISEWNETVAKGERLNRVLDRRWSPSDRDPGQLSD